MVKRAESSENPEGLTKGGVGCLTTMVALPFILGGLAMLIFAGVLFAKDKPNATGAAIFGAIVLAMGTAMEIGILWLYRAGKRARIRAAESPKQPWLWKDQWASGRLVDSSKQTTFVFGLIAIFWNAVSWTVTLLIGFDEIFGKTKEAMFVLIFPAVGLILLIAAGWMFVRWRKFGDSVLEIETLPGVVGGWFAGTVQTSVPILTNDGLSIMLRCVNRVTTGSGKNRSTSEYTLYEDEQILTGRLPAARGGGNSIPISFRIPADCEPTSDRGNNDILWRLRLHGEMPGADYVANFVLPIYHDSFDAAFVPKAEAIAARLRSSQQATAKSRSSLPMTQDAAGRKRFDFPASRNRSTAVFATFFCLFFAGIVAAIIAFGAPLLFAGIFGVATLGIAYACVILWFRSVEITLDRHGVERRRTMLGIRTHHIFRKADVTAARYKITADVNGQSLYTVSLDLSNSKSESLVSGLVQKDAKELVEQIAAALEVNASPEQRRA